MLATSISRHVCSRCRLRLLELFENGFSHPVRERSSSRRAPAGYNQFRIGPLRYLTTATSKREDYVRNTAHPRNEESDLRDTSASLEFTARNARQSFGENLPAGFLSAEEYAVYERLYGAPLGQVTQDDVEVSQSWDEVVDSQAEQRLFQQGSDGELEAIDLDTEDPQLDRLAQADSDEADVQSALGARTDSSNTEYANRVGGEVREMLLAEQGKNITKNLGRIFEASGVNFVEENSDQITNHEEAGDPVAYPSADSMRIHPLTVAGRFSTSPATINLPAAAFVDPAASQLEDLSNKHLTEVAERTFGGPGLPFSTATPVSKRHVQQKPIALEAAQTQMAEMEADVFLAAVMPGAYAAILATLVEVRKRIGGEWLNNLMNQEGGPRMLDAGAAGAGVIAWREVLKAEWTRLQGESTPKTADTPLGKATVVTGSTALRLRASKLLENTTFLPRLPDYVHTSDPETLIDGRPTPQRKQYDLIVAPNTLWPLREDYMRKQHVQNLWSLLNPEGGVLILIEKGLPRGFEMIAGARDMLLANHISSPKSESDANELQDPSQSSLMSKETAMIVAPCTNHGKCPMYLSPGRSNGRKDFCHFSQRFIRPPYLQRILGANDRNHEDIQFSYVAVRRGRDERQSLDLVQGEEATEAAFAGFEADTLEARNGSNLSGVNTLALPRAILPPLKRQGHVTLDLCTPAGRIERWTVPRSFSKQAYRDARKSQWGDLWALGAKTRTPRNIRLGLIKDSKKSKGKNVFEIQVGDQGMEGMKLVKGGANKREKRNKRGRRIEPSEIGLGDDYQQGGWSKPQR